MPYARKYTKASKPVKKVYKKKTPARRKRHPKRINDTIKYTIQNTSTQREYYPVIASKLDKMSTFFQNGAATEQTLASILRTNANYISFKTNFMYVRHPRIKVTLIPERWVATDSSNADGEKPRIHWISDTGDVAAFKVGATSLSLQEAESIGKSKYHNAQFTKPFIFYIHMIERKVGGSSGQAFDSANAWCPTVSGDSETGVAYIPNQNLYIGFSNISNVSQFKYKTEIEYQIVFKTPYHLEV